MGNLPGKQAPGSPGITARAGACPTSAPSTLLNRSAAGERIRCREPRGAAFPAQQPCSLRAAAGAMLCVCASVAWMHTQGVCTAVHAGCDRGTPEPCGGIAGAVAAAASNGPIPSEVFPCVWVLGRSCVSVACPWAVAPSHST